MQSLASSFHALTISRPTSPLREVRLYGLVKQITSDSLAKFFGEVVQILEVRLHPQVHDYVWAQLFVHSEEDVHQCLNLKEKLASCGITMSRHPAILTPASTPCLDRASHSAAQFASFHTKRPYPLNRNPASTVQGSFPLHRNLYVLNLPVSMSDVEFEGTFAAFGMVEHAKLLSQLDVQGRRRGFILMSTHQEAAKAMDEMHGKWLNGFRIDISWALVQREARPGQGGGNTLSNRVIHPPMAGSRQQPPVECSVIVENLDPINFPNAGTICSTFGHFGNVVRVTVLPGACTGIGHSKGLSAVIQFEWPQSAVLLLSAHGLKLGERAISTRPLIPRTGHPLLSSQPPDANSQPRRLPFPSYLRDDRTPLPDIDEEEAELRNFHFNPFESESTLKPDSEPFVPRMIEQDITMRDHNSSSPAREGDSNDSGSGGQSVNTASTLWERGRKV